MTGPNPITVLGSVVRARRLRPPGPRGTAALDHDALNPILDAVAERGVAALEGRSDLTDYIADASRVEPDSLDRPEALAFWLNLYNAGALDLARRAHERSVGTVLRVPRGFDRPFITIDGEDLSLEGIEHGKVRRFGDPRIHAALVCGSASCPTLRGIAYGGADLDAELEDQMRAFLAAGGAEADTDHGVLRLSRVFLWYGADFVRPHRMPTLLPASRPKIRRALQSWLPSPMSDWVRATRPHVAYQSYDWSLRCSIRRPT